MALEGRFKHLLREMLKKHEIDEQYIDSSLSYWENKENIERQFGLKLRLSNEKLYPVVEELCQTGDECEACEVYQDLPAPKVASQKMPVICGLPEWLPTTEKEFAEMQKALRKLPIYTGEEAAYV